MLTWRRTRSKTFHVFFNFYICRKDGKFTDTQLNWINWKSQVQVAWLIMLTTRSIELWNASNEFKFVPKTEGLIAWWVAARDSSDLFEHSKMVRRTLKYHRNAAIMGKSINRPFLPFTCCYFNDQWTPSAATQVNFFHFTARLSRSCSTSCATYESINILYNLVGCH